MHQTIRKIGFLCVLYCTLSTSALAVSLDTEGKGGFCVFSCKVTSVTLKTYTTQKSLYNLEGYCYYTPGGPAAACPPGQQPISGILEWIHDKNLNMATEIFSQAGHQYANTMNRCPQNPWTNEAVPCTNVIKNFKNTQFNVFQGPYPISASLMTPAQKQSLKQQEAQTTPIIIAPAAPKILAPVSNQVFPAPATVKIKVKHDPVHTVVFEIKWRSKKPKPGEWPETYTDITEIVPENVVRSNGATTADLIIDKTGQWLLRSRANFPNAPWSEVTFVVAPTMQILQPDKKLIPPLKKMQ
jgi:hypothetical protein